MVIHVHLKLYFKDEAPFGLKIRLNFVLGHNLFLKAHGLLEPCPPKAVCFPER